MAALHPSLALVLTCVKDVFERPGAGLRVYDFNTDDRAFLRGSGSFKFTGSPGEPRQGHVRVVGNTSYYRVEVFVDFMDPDGLKKSFGPRWLRQRYGLARKDVRSPKVRKFAAYALSRVKAHFAQLTVQEIHDL